MHGTCVALGGVCTLLRGLPGAGKSDLALRFLFLPEARLGARPTLISDDQVILRRERDSIVASCPPRLAGKIEIRGAGIVRLTDRVESAELKLVVDLDGTSAEPRFPEDSCFEDVLGVPLRRIVLDPFELSAHIKLALIMQNVGVTDVD